MEHPVVAVVDLETTGLDPGRDAIIQVAVIRREQGAVRRFASLVRPPAGVPEAVLRLTGLNPDALAAAPPWPVVQPQVAALLEGAVLAGHQAGFDRAFLGETVPAGSPVLDTLLWSRIAWPGLASYRLENLVEARGLTVEPWPGLPRADYHDARTDAAAAWALVEDLAQDLAGLPVDVRQDLERLLPEEWGVWQALAGDAPRSAARSPLRAPWREEAGGSEPEAYDGPLPGAGWWLGAEGPLAASWPGYEPRPAQAALARAVEAAWEQDRLLVAEAGTGTGKSLGYLVPAALAGLGRGERVLVTTHTVALQDQLWQKDLPAVTGRLPVRTALLKGRGRYLCLWKAEEAWGRAAGQELALSLPERQAWAQLLVFMARAEAGDADELHAVNGEVRRLWPALQADREACAGPRCPFSGPCFMRRAYRQAQAAHVVVTNHALFLAHAALGEGGLPPYRRLVVDEAHHLEDAAAQAFGFRLDLAELDRVLGTRLAVRRGAQVAEVAAGLENQRGRARAVREEAGRLGARLAAGGP
ncbi:MAG: exonuclease domain-containing protein, partial [Firmicutes bacterium]|nr:exonuclease domain-containing protein [Bacillota bacterium]